jgi:hypothetical protein
MSWGAARDTVEKLKARRLPKDVTASSANAISGVQELLVRSASSEPCDMARHGVRALVECCRQCCFGQSSAARWQ